LILRFLSACVLGVFLASVAIAQGTQLSFGAIKADPSQPVEVTADNLEVDQTTGQATFTGNVLVTQGEMKLSADKVQVIYDQEARKIARMDATGNVLLVSGPDAAEAQNAEYTVDSGTIVMTGNVLLNQGPSTIAGERMVVDLTTGAAQMSGRVRTLLNTGGD
jgi:lipopolysaccharide export system protein LptA